MTHETDRLVGALQACIGTGLACAARFVCGLLGPPTLAYLWEHRVRSRVLFPGAAMFEAAYAAEAALLGAMLLHDGLGAAEPGCNVHIIPVRRSGLGLQVDSKGFPSQRTRTCLGLEANPSPAVPCQRKALGCAREGQARVRGAGASVAASHTSIGGASNRRTCMRKRSLSPSRAA